MSQGGQEVEIKLPATDAESARRLLYRAGFRVYKRRVFEDNTVFDTPTHTLSRAAQLLRLREAGGKAILTYKGTPVAAKHKSREEQEVEVSDPAKIRIIVERLGFKPAFRYQKYRTEFKRPRESGVATLDETPIGVYLELEGQPAWIDRTARRLGYREADYIISSYGRLFGEWRKRNQAKQTDMTW